MKINQQNEEIKACIKDPIYFINKYVKIRSSKGNIPFKLYDFQKDLVSALHEGKSICLYKRRQIGATSLVLALYLHKMIFSNNLNILYTTSSSTYYSSNSFKLMYRSLPEFIKNYTKISPGIDCYSNKNSNIYFKNNFYNIDELRKEVFTDVSVEDVSIFAYEPNMASKMHRTIDDGGVIYITSLPPQSLNDSWVSKLHFEAFLGVNNFIPVSITTKHLKRRK